MGQAVVLWWVVQIQRKSLHLGPLSPPYLQYSTSPFCPILPPFHALINNRRAVADDDDEDTVPTGQDDTVVERQNDHFQQLKV